MITTQTLPWPEGARDRIGEERRVCEESRRLHKRTEKDVDGEGHKTERVVLR